MERLVELSRLNNDQKVYADGLSVETVGHLVIVTATNEKILSKPMVRIQEGYEGKKYRGVKVSMSQFKKWYRPRHSGKFSYYTDWVGFNFPGSAVLDFMKFYSDEMTEAEKALISKLDLTSIHDKYVIAIMQGAESTMLHEMCHALYFLDREYKQEMDAYLLTMEFRLELRKLLAQTDYHNVVWDDEIQAYLIAGIQDFEVDDKPVYSNIDKFKTVITEMTGIFNKRIQRYPELQAKIGGC